jgi:surface protein
MFSGCSIFNGDISIWNTSNVRNMEDMFNNCSNFNRDISRWNVRRVTNNLNMFLNCPIQENFKPIFSDQQALAVHQIAVQDRDIGNEIHKEIAKIDLERFNNFLKTKVNSEFNNSINFAQYISNTITTIINKINNEEEKNNLLSKLNIVMEQRLRNLNYTQFSPSTLKCVFYSLEYLKMQPNEFQIAYVKDFLNESISAGVTNNKNMSCAMGMLERLIISLRYACIVMLDDKSIETDKKKEYEELIDNLIPPPEKSIDSFIQKWYKIHKNTSKEAFPKEMTNEEIKKNLETYLFEEFPENIYPDRAKIDELISKKIKEYEDSIGFDDESFSYGGGKKKTRKNKKNRRKENIEFL